MAMNQTCYGLVPKINTPFAIYCLARKAIDRLVAAAHGSVFDTITTRTFESTPILVPPQTVLSAFEVSVTPIFERIRVGIRESGALVATRDTLLPKLLSGEIRVPEAEKAVEEAVG
jgi:type I restriction enzyme S subunit